MCAAMRVTLILAACVAFPRIVHSSSLPSVLEAAKAAGKFQTLTAALDAANLADTLNSAGNFTVFAPTDQAFSTLLSGLGIDAPTLLGKGPQFLANILTFHVASGTVLSSELQDGMMIQSLQGARLAVGISGKVVTIGGAKVTTADILCSNGVVHVIDEVLQPPSTMQSGGCSRALHGGASCILALHGGAVGWDENVWKVRTDGVMGGRSSGSVAFKDDAMMFTGRINLNGGGFSSLRVESSLDLSDYAGLLLVTSTSPFAAGQSPLAIHVTMRDKSGYGFSAPVAIPVAASQTKHRVLAPWADFDHASRWGWAGCNRCKFDPSSVQSLEFYVLFQDGPFEVHIHEVSAVKSLADGPGQPTSPALPAMEQPGSVAQFLEAAISTAAPLYNKGYYGLCEVIYASVVRSILATPGAPAPARGVACAALARASTGSRKEKAWIFRRAMDAIHSDMEGISRKNERSYPTEVRGPWLADSPQLAGKACSLMLAGHSSFGMAAPVASSPPAKSDNIRGTEDFLGPFGKMGITGHNDFPLEMVRNPSACAELCRQNSQCQSFDYGARGHVIGECWMSKATRELAASAYERWELYDFYERQAEAVQIVGTVGVTVPGVTQQQMEQAMKKALAAEFGVIENVVELVVTESRRLVEFIAKSRQLAGTWNVEFTITILASKRMSMETKVASLKRNNDGLKAEIVTALQAAGVEASIASSVQMSSSGPTANVVALDVATPQAAGLESTMPGNEPMSSNTRTDTTTPIESNVLMFALIGAGAVIVSLLGVIARLMYRRRSAVAPSKNQVVGVPVDAVVSSEPVTSGAKDSIGSIVAIGHPVVLTDPVKVEDM